MAETVDEEELFTPTNEYIASFVWNSGFISVAYYNISSLELSVSFETVDLKPDFWHLKNLFRQINTTTVLASGPAIFLTTIMQLLGLPDNANPNDFRVSRVKSTSTAEFLVYTNNEKSLQTSRKRILELKLSRMDSLISEQERCNFIETILPLNQNLVVHSLGNLLSYLDANWKHLFLRTDRNPVISGVHVYHLESTLLMDESTFSALQVFAAKDHPSGFKKSSHGSSKEGFSLFSFMNTCSSRIGSNEMRMMLQQPTRDLAELHSRHAAIEWFMDGKNETVMAKIRSSLRNISNVSEVFLKLVTSCGKATLWKNLKRSLYYAQCTGILCEQIMETDREAIQGTVLEEICKISKERCALQETLDNVNIIVDLDEGLREGRFCVKFGLDPDLDAKKMKMVDVLNVLSDAAKDELENLPQFVNEVTVHFVHEMGFLLSIPLAIDTSPETVSSNSNLKFIYKTSTSYIFNTPLCEELTKNYGHLYTEICERENHICDRFLENIREKLADLQYAVKLCAKLDCLMSMAAFCVSQNLQKPEILSGEKTLEILNGRHILLDLKRKFVPNNTSISVIKRNLITILIAPNASGKSVYLKEVAQIVYLAHVGCFVPAEAVRLTLVDAIYTRIFSPESLYQAKSSFLIELQQMGNVMTNSSSDSLILVDELGQGTNENDGKALLISCLEHLIARGDASPMTILTTHYSCIYDAMADREWVCFKSFRMMRNSDGSISSTFKLFEGRSLENYARDCFEVKQFMRRTMGNESLDGNGGTSPNNNAETGIVNIADSIYKIKIKSALELLRAYLRNREINDSDDNLVEIFKDTRI